MSTLKRNNAKRNTAPVRCFGEKHVKENTISAARASGARILLPGTIYNYGPDAFPVLREDSPQHAHAG